MRYIQCRVLIILFYCFKRCHELVNGKAEKKRESLEWDRKGNGKT